MSPMKTSKTMAGRSRAAAAPPVAAARPEGSVRSRIIRAAFGLFREQGFGATTMLEIATRAQLSKRDVYAHFANKHAVLAECVAERAGSMRAPLASGGLPQSREALAAQLVALGQSVLRNVSRPEVLMVYRLTIAESDRAPELARLLDRNGRAANHKALADLLAEAQTAGLIQAADPMRLAVRYFAVLWDSLLVELIMRLRPAPSQDEVDARALAATEAVMALASRQSS